jgi:hypothetical protein
MMSTATATAAVKGGGPKVCGAADAEGGAERDRDTGAKYCGPGRRVQGTRL